MSPYSPQSSGVGTPSSPLTGTDPTVYSPDVARRARSNTKSRRDNLSIDTVVANAKHALRNLDEAEARRALKLPAPKSRKLEGDFVNELDEHSNDFISRYLKVVMLPDGTQHGEDPDHEFVAVCRQMKPYACFLNAVPKVKCEEKTFVKLSGVFIAFDDLQQATIAKDLLQQHRFIVEYTTAYEYALIQQRDTGLVNEFEGQIRLSIKIDPVVDESNNFTFADTDFAVVAKAVETVCNAFGPVRNVLHVETDDVHSFVTFRVEFHSVEASERAVHSLRRNGVWGESAKSTYRWYTASPARWSGERAATSPHRFQSRIDEHGRIYGYRVNPLREALPPKYRSNHPQEEQNCIARDRILNGRDVRTTLMLRNIPNSLDRMTLKTILDDCCFGTYDFVYLRIDFSTGQNVGYAFINFTDNDGMIALLDKWQGQPWTGWKSKDLDSSKCAQLSYATIQGSEALECRFRNSSVMQETPYVRPRKFLPYKDASDKNVVRLASTELSMPRPDNLAKLQRSMDSAQATGLFPPQGNSYGMQARCRVSTYDRGTPRDLMYGAGHHGGLTYEEKHNIEVWYAHMFGGGLGGLIPFEYIPASCITSYSSNFGGNNMSGPHGVVGGPVYGYQRNVMATPSRRSYKAPSSARYSGGYDCSNPFN